MIDCLVLPNRDVIRNTSIVGSIEILNDTFRFEDYIDGCRDEDDINANYLSYALSNANNSFWQKISRGYQMNQY